MNVFAAEQDQFPVVCLSCLADSIDAELRNDWGSFDVAVPIHPQPVREDVFLGLAVDQAE